jgi:hypothetical protein
MERSYEWEIMEDMGDGYEYSRGDIVTQREEEGSENTEGEWGAFA